MRYAMAARHNRLVHRGEADCTHVPYSLDRVYTLANEEIRKEAMVKRGRLPSVCQHDEGFSLSPHAHGVDKPAFMCNVPCGYSLNFDPALFPEGIAILDGPNPNLHRKDMVPYAPFPKPQ